MLTYEKFVQTCQSIRDGLDTLERWGADHFGEIASEASDGPWEPDAAPLLLDPASEHAAPMTFADVEAAAVPFIVPEPPEEVSTVAPPATAAPAPRPPARPSSPPPRPKYFRVVHGSGGQKLPGVADQLCMARTQGEAETLKGYLERQYPGWANMLVVRAE